MYDRDFLNFSPSCFGVSDIDMANGCNNIYCKILAKIDMYSIYTGCFINLQRQPGRQAGKRAKDNNVATGCAKIRLRKSPAESLKLAQFSFIKGCCDVDLVHCNVLIGFTNFQY